MPARHAERRGLLTSAHRAVTSLFGRGDGLAVTGEWVGSVGGRVLCSLLVFSFLSFVLQIIRDLIVFRRLSAAKEQGRSNVPECEGGGKASLAGVETSPSIQKELEKGDRAEWSKTGIVALTAYRFYTGYLSATWLPYLLAMEGQDLWRENQSVFMGVAKLIYGLTILLNPVFGLLGDQAVVLSHGVGRRLFVCIGVCLACVGILTCLLSAQLHNFWTFILGILLWRLGEALNDVTTEALVPEMVPQAQFKIASAIKASSFLFGGLFGYVLLILFVEVHYSWLYYSYLAGMFLCAVPSLLLLGSAAPTRAPRERGEGVLGSMSRAYVLPTSYEGGFPRACLAVFVFSLGTSPMFFLLLIVRDVVGEVNPIKLQQNFSEVSIVFFISAAIASVAGAFFEHPAPATGTPDRSAKLAEIRKKKVQSLILSMCAFGAVIALIPALALFDDPVRAESAFCVLSVLFGGAFGSAFSRFQDCTWAELPLNSDIANAMGFNVMSRLLGVGLGNFGAGLVLDCFYTGNEVARTRHAGQAALFQYMFRPQSADMPQVYRPVGYLVLCELCAFFVFVAAYIIWDALKIPAPDTDKTAP